MLQMRLQIMILTVILIFVMYDWLGIINLANFSPSLGLSLLIPGPV